MRYWLYAAVLVAGSAFSILFTGESYTEPETGFGDLSIVSIIAGDRAFLPLLLAAAVGALVGSAGRWRFVLLVPAGALYTIVAVYGVPPVFSPGEWRLFGYRIGNDVIAAANTMYAEPVPYDLAPGIFVMILPAVVVLATFATSAALYEGSPVLSVAVLGLTIGVLSTVSFEDGAGPFFAVFLACAVGLLLAAGSVGAGGLGRAALVAGAAVVALALLVPRLPFNDATISPGMIDWTRIGTGGTSRLDVQADVGDYLAAGRDAELFRVESSEPLLWRGGTLDSFDGVRWSDTTTPVEDDGAELAPGVPTRTVDQEVEVLNAKTDVLFGGYKIVETDQPYADVNSDSSWSMDEPFEEGSTYRVRSEIPQPSEGQLQAAGTTYPSSVERKFLQLPDSTPDIVGETARKIDEGGDYDASTPYNAARSVERYLIYDGGFIYNLDVSYRRADKAVEEFLGDGKEGFCTQFATSMALILREMDIPSRVVYGATSGERVEDGEYVVTGSNMHTWVEVYFPGVGWYPFNPTPGFSMPSTMEANAPRPSIPVPSTPLGPQENNFALRQQVGEQRQTPEQRERETARQEGRDAAPSGEERLPLWPLFVFGPALLVAATPISKRALAARGRPEDLYGDLAGRLRDALPPNTAAVADSPALTPTERVLLLAGAAGVAEEPVRRFARAYSDHLYSAAGDAGAVSAAHRRALRAYGGLPLWKRTLAALNPSSLLARMGKSLAAVRTRAGKALRAKAHGVFRKGR
ncbi:MAG: FIG001454: Transglutaminase-like enzymes, putative cysteine proteases [uncultured Rubrobacteraceae bacterium]|uniref:FIG001454: Transglutaminase-like enzymes, putative cysteine proteases n=1 Tax=uncultured Rubrobacteraceae bacterium TaxID=349277 RepID=A0A6J4RBA4_9ACTN|nr:MAG: FIG001454: Transglutaminase-like enzymes, putative cysteine proteases [uncultured Rubrobacteraceae bacterium]